MSTSNDATSRNVLENKNQQRKEENANAHKDGYENTQKDKHKKRHEKKKISNATSTTSPTNSGNNNSLTAISSGSNNICNVPNITLATQFSIQRTDSDGCLRMKISAIRPTTTITVATASTEITDNFVINPTSVQKANFVKCKNNKEDKTLSKNNPSDSLKFKISPSSRDKIRNNDNKMKNMTPVIVNSSSNIVNEDAQMPINISAATASKLACLSDATDSGCSEATNTTTATLGQEKISKRKIKRKKALLKANDSKRVLKTLKPLEIAIENSFSTDTEDETLAKKLVISNVEAIKQRAPRILLTAINSRNLTANFSTVPSNLHTSLSSLQQGTDHIGLSSSDNELPNVRAAIERVVGETDEDDNLSSSHFHKAKTKHLPQYQSTLLQDFMEKTQMLGQTQTSNDCVKPKSTSSQNDILIQLNTNSQSESMTSSSASNSKKRRGRPKKPEKDSGLIKSVSPVHTSNKNSNINESGDSGVISTTSVSTQSTSPHPCTTLASSSANDNTSSTNSPNKNSNTTPEKQTHEVSSSSSASKPKIDIALLDKRMYATERVLYPPPRNKRRQSTSVVLASVSEKQRPSPSQMQQHTSKDDLQLDPVWRKIDVNRKFRRPSVCSTTGYKSDGGMDDRAKERSSKSTVCSKVLAAKSGYVSDYGACSFRFSRHTKHSSNNSGYKSDASCKSRYSIKSCVSRKSRAKSCGYRSDCKESVLSSSKSSKFRRKRRASIMQKSLGSLKDEQDILQLAGLSLGQSSEESNEYVCKPSLEKLPTTSASKKYGEINRYIATGEYFGRGSNSQHHSHNSFASISNNSTQIFDVPTRMPQTPSKITLLQRKNSTTSEFANDLLQLPESNQTARKIKSRRSSVASFCSSFYSVGTTKLKRRRRRKSFRSHNSSSKHVVTDSKLLTEIEILTNTFSTRCRIQTSNVSDKLTAGNISQKEKLMAEATKLQQSLAAAAVAASTSASSSSKRDSNRDKRSVKKRKISENLDFAMLSARAEGNSLPPGSSSGQGTSSKRRHKKASSSSPDDHKLPLKKRHYLLTPGEKSSEVSVAVAAKLFANNAEAWAAAAAAAKSTANTKSQQQFNAKTAKANLTPKKRHLLQQSPHRLNEDTNSNKTASTLSPLRVAVGDPNSISGGKLLDISPQSLSNLKQASEAVNKKRSRLEGVVSKIATTHGEDLLTGSRTKSSLSTVLQIESESSSCPPPGIFEPSVELEIQIPPITKLSEATSTIITKSEVDSPLLNELNKEFADTSAKSSGARVVESLLNKTGGNLILKRKRKKINRTGFPTLKRKKRKINENPTLDINEDDNQRPDDISKKIVIESLEKSPEKQCDRVPKQGETSQTFLERNNRTPRLSVVALERLQESPLSTKDKTPPKEIQFPTDPISTPKTRHTRNLTKKRNIKEEKQAVFMEPMSTTESDKSQRLHKQEDDQDDKPLALRARRSKAVLESKKDATILSPHTKKSIVSKTAKSLLASNIKLPAGVDPKTILSCKIKLKRRNSIHPLAARKSPVALAPLSKLIRETSRTAEEIDMDAKVKDCNINYAEHDILPINETQLCTLNGDTEASDTSDEKSSTNSFVTKRIKMIKKTYLPAGLFSEYFKVAQTATRRNLNKKDNDKKTDIDKTICAESINISANKEGEVLKFPLLPPPPYCERYLRRTEYDFELPYDIWWAYKNAKLPSRITVPSWNFRKIRTNIYAENVKPAPIGANDHPMCNCKSSVGCGDNCLNRMVYTECSPSNCPSREKCRNQKIQKHDIAPGVERFMTENKGWGVRTKLPIEKGTYILEYVGEVVTEREFKDRMATIYLNDTHHYCLHLDGGLVIDGQRMGSDCRFVNHSCEPNCEMQKWSVNGLSRMALFAKRNIAEGEELTYDYNFSLFNPSEGQPCRCNTPNCRGVIGGKSQRVKPLPVENKPTNENAPKEDRKGRQRKRKARKNAQRQTTRDIATPTRMQPLSEKEKKLVKQYSVFLMRNFEKIRAKKCKRKATTKIANENKPQTPTNICNTLHIGSNAGTPLSITQRRPSTPASLAAQISALCTARNIKTRGLTLAVQDPEVEKMAKMAKILRDICTNLELTKNPENPDQTLVSVLQNNTLLASSASKKKKSFKMQQKQVTDLRTIQNNIEHGYYKVPSEFNADMHKIFEEAKTTFGKKDEMKLKLINLLEIAFAEEKSKHYSALFELLGEEALVKDFNNDNYSKSLDLNNHKNKSLENSLTPDSPTPLTNNVTPIAEDIIRCICGLFRDEGLMIQCARCMVWQHTECTKADVNADNYHCEQCEPRKVDREIPLDDYTDEGYRYYLTLMRGTSLQVRQGDAVYVLRDIPVRDSTGNIVPSKKHTYETIGDVDFNECDIFRVERLWKDDVGKRFIFGHHFLRPHETFHEPSRKFYPNEVVRVPLYEVVPIDLVMGRCWVLDRTTFCKGRPIECTDETHCFICELRVDKSARFFSKAKTNHPTCTKNYAFRKFCEKLKISKTYAPHDVDPSMLKPKKQKADNDQSTLTAATTSATATPLLNSPTSCMLLVSRQELNKTPQIQPKKRPGNKSPLNISSSPTHSLQNSKLLVATFKEKRLRLESVLKIIKSIRVPSSTQNHEPPVDLSYLLKGRGARHRKILTF